MTKKVLFAGESHMIYTTHVKGFDVFYTTEYDSGEEQIKKTFESAGYEFTYLPNHLAGDHFPYTMEELKQYDLIVLSDIGANTLLLPKDVFFKCEMRPNRCDLIRDYVMDGGSLLMIGGYMTFSGIDAKGKWQDTAVQEVFPVQLLSTDDRMEHPEGIRPVAVKDHEVVAGLGEFPRVLGYNRTEPKAGAEVIAEVGGNPFIAVGEFGKGRSAAFTTDCAPHWAPPEFCEWDNYDKLFQQIAAWLTKK